MLTATDSIGSMSPNLQRSPTLNITRQVHRVCKLYDAHMLLAVRYVLSLRF